MKHLIGGWAFGTATGGWWLFSKMVKGKAIDAFMWSAMVIGPLAGLAAWGLLP